MNLALHGFLLQVLLSILNLHHGSLLCSAGEPGYLDFDNLPETNFSCQGKVIGGYYADVEAGCQMFHVCTIGQKDEIMDIKFLCLNGTVFDQETRVCERVDEVDCSKSERFYNLNLELYGNNAVTLSLHENNEDDIDPLDPVDDHQRTTSARPTTTTTPAPTTSKPSKPSTTLSPSPFSHPTGYPEHFQPQPPFPQIHTSQSKSLYDDKNGGYHHQYIFHSGERNNNQQATSYQLFSNQGVSSTTVQPPQVHQIRFSSTPSPQIVHNEPSTVAPLFHATSSTIQTLLNSNVNSPGLINPIYHNHGIVSTTEQFAIHSNNPRDTSEYRESMEQSIRPLEAVQSINKGKVSKLTISPVPTPEPLRSVQTKISSHTTQQQRITGGFLPTPATHETTVRSFYPTPRTSSKSSQSSQTNSEQVTQHIHVLPPVQIPQLKPHQITINLPPPDLQRIVQNPSSLLPSQSRVIVTAKASVSDESGRPLNTTQLVTLPLPTIPASYDDYKEGDESFDPFYRDVPKIRNRRRVHGGRSIARSKRSVGQTKSSMVSFVYGGDSRKEQDAQSESTKKKEMIGVDAERQDFQSIKESLMKFRDILFGEDYAEDIFSGAFGGSKAGEAADGRKGKHGKKESLEDLETKASKSFKDREYDEDDTDEKTKKNEDVSDKESGAIEIPLSFDTKASDAEEYIDVEGGKKVELRPEDREEEIGSHDEHEEEEKKEDEDTSSSGKENIGEGRQLDTKTKEPEKFIDVVVLDPKEYSKWKSLEDEASSSATEKEEISTDVPVVSSTGRATVATVEDYSEDKKDPGAPKTNQDVAEEIGQAKKIDGEPREIVEEEKPKEQKPNPRRKSSRIRSSRGKISAKKEMKIDHDVVAKVPEEKVSIENIETTTVVVNSEAEIIDRHIFDEPESQTSKEVDTRAVSNHNGYLKSLRVGKDQDLGKESRKGEANEYETSQKQSKSLEGKAGKIEIEEPMDHEERVTAATLPKNEVEETTKYFNEEKPEAVAEENISGEEKNYHEKKSSVEHKVVEDVATIAFSTENSKEGSHEVTKSSGKIESTKFEDLDYFSKETSSHKQDKHRPLKVDDEEEEEEEEDGLEQENNQSQEYAATKGEETSSQEVSSEYHDSTEASYETTLEDVAEEDYSDYQNSEVPTTSSEQTDSEETPTSKDHTLEEDDEDESTLSNQEESTEGVLKFTDELPKERKEDTTESKKSSESIENIPHDYVDDNYEPDNYKERETSASNSLSAEKLGKQVPSNPKSAKGDETTDPTEQPESTSSKDTNADEEQSQTTSATTSTTTSTTTTTTTPTTTSTSTTTTPRPPPLKLFKPISIRKNYNYIPPTTTPNTVIIRPRSNLLNPKPAKPAKSYNEMAPKPVIRKFTSLTRKPSTTTSATTIAEEDTTVIPDQVVATTDAARSEENVLESKLEAAKGDDDQDPSPSEQKSPTNARKVAEESFTPYPVTRLSILARTIEDTLTKVDSSTDEPITSKNFTLLDVEVASTTSGPISSTSAEPVDAEEVSSTTVESIDEVETTVESSTKSLEEDLAQVATSSTTTEISLTPGTAKNDAEEEGSTTVTPVRRKLVGLKRQGGFNCLEREMYRFYGDNRDCRLFHYCSPGFTSRQVLDFRFVCEEGTAFDEVSQSCRHDSEKRECLDRQW